MKIKAFVVVFLATLFIFSTPSFARGHGGHHNSYVKGYYLCARSSSLSS